MEDRNETVIVPSPSALRWREGFFNISEAGFRVFRPDAWASLQIAMELLKRPYSRLAEERDADLIVAPRAELAEEGYVLQIAPKKITLEASTQRGAFYAVMTLLQLLKQFPDRVPCCEIEDAPVMPLRGVLLDISRGKVPKLDTILAIVDRMALLKLNHLQLYIEGFSFAYPSFREYWADETPMTPEEIARLDAYCASRLIDLVPCQNTLGHMGPWLEQDAFRHLAEQEAGAAPAGFRIPPMTLNPRDPESVQLVEQITGDLLPCYSSNCYNLCLDEPFGLGQGKSKAFAKKEGIGKLYFDYTLEMHKIAQKHGKKMMMWGDMLAKHPELLPLLPKDITVLEWGYEAEHPFEERARRLQLAGLDYCLCTGTNSWSSYLGLTDNMLGNASAALRAACRYGAKGIIVTDWGDGGHQQYFFASYPGIVCSAAAAWSRAIPSEADLAAWLDVFIYEDRAKVMGRLSLDAGRYCRYEEFRMPCRTIVSFLLLGSVRGNLQLKIMLYLFMNSFLKKFVPQNVFLSYQQEYRRRKPFAAQPLLDDLERLEARLAGHSMRCADAKLLEAEWKNTLVLIRLLQNIRSVMANSRKRSKAKREETLSEINALACSYIENHDYAWHERNKSGGFQRSIAPVQKLSAAVCGSRAIRKCAQSESIQQK